MRTFLLIIGLILFYASPSWSQVAQPATPTQQTATHADACTPINAQAAASAQTTLTIPAPPGNQYIYIAEIDFDYTCGTACGAATTSNSTTSNLGGIKWAIAFPTTANTMYSRIFNYGPGGMRSVTPGTAVTIVGATTQTNMTQTINACYWVGY